jgi:hypothetical protein
MFVQMVIFIMQNGKELYNTGGRCRYLLGPHTAEERRPLSIYQYSVFSIH